MAFRAGLAARIKWDGYRIIARKDADRVHLWTRPEPITPENKEPEFRAAALTRLLRAVTRFRILFK
jgi:ATP-dependent DNA ligase